MFLHFIFRMKVAVHVLSWRDIFYWDWKLRCTCSVDVTFAHQIVVLNCKVYVSCRNWNSTGRKSSHVSTKNPKGVMKENWIVNNPIAGQFLRHPLLCEVRTYTSILKSEHIQTFWSLELSRYIDWTSMSPELNLAYFHVTFNKQNYISLC